MLAAPDRQKSTGRLRTSSSELSELMAQLAPGGFQLGGFQLLHLGVGQPASVQILLCSPNTEQERGGLYVDMGRFARGVDDGEGLRTGHMARLTDDLPWSDESEPERGAFDAKHFARGGDFGEGRRPS